MKDVIGSPGTVTSLILRIGQCGLAAASLGVMISSRGFSIYTAFCYLIASMGLQFLWSLGLAFIDAYALKRKREIQNPALVSLFAVGDWVTSMLSLAAACSSTGLIVLYAKDLPVCRHEKQMPCGKYEVSIVLAFSSWILAAVSSHVMVWVLASV